MFDDKRQRKRVTRAVAIGLLLVASATGCGGGGSDAGAIIATPLGAGFTPSGSASAANMVRMTGTTGGDMVTVQVVIGGPTTSADLYSFAFDLVLGDATVAEYVGGSATMGTALTMNGGQTSQVLVSQIGNRVTVGVTKVGGGTGNGVVAAGEESVVELAFRLRRAGATTLRIEGSPPNNAAALDSVGGNVGSVAFDGVAATLTGT